MKHILAKREKPELQLTRSHNHRLEQYVGIPFLRTVAHLRHIQESSALVWSKVLVAVCRPQNPELAVGSL